MLVVASLRTVFRRSCIAIKCGGLKCTGVEILNVVDIVERMCSDEGTANRPCGQNMQAETKWELP